MSCNHGPCCQARHEIQNDHCVLAWIASSVRQAVTNSQVSMGESSSEEVGQSEPPGQESEVFVGRMEPAAKRRSTPRRHTMEFSENDSYPPKDLSQAAQSNSPLLIF